jgi:hypothetical protein
VFFAKTWKMTLFSISGNGCWSLNWFFRIQNDILHFFCKKPKNAKNDICKIRKSTCWPVMCTIVIRHFYRLLNHIWVCPRTTFIQSDKNGKTTLQKCKFLLFFALLSAFVSSFSPKGTFCHPKSLY